MMRLGISALLIAGSVVIAEAGTAEAFSGADFTTVQQGSRGEDVRAVQYLLGYWGFGVTVDGVFGSSTKTKVQQFQTAKGLSSDGVIGPGTWAALTPTLALGAGPNNAVRALQALLNGKRDPFSPQWGSVTVDGVFGTGTRSVVMSFQSHMSITSDGVVGPTTWKNLVWHYVLAYGNGQICGPNQPNSESWGTAASIEAIRRSGVLFAAEATGKLPFWDFSLQHGDDISGHDTHERGMDADIGLISTNDQQCAGSGNGGRGMTCASSFYDRPKTRAMVDDMVGASGGWIKSGIFNDSLVNQFYTWMNSDGGSCSSGDHRHHIHMRWCVQYYPSSTTPSYFPSGANYDC